MHDSGDRVAGRAPGGSKQPSQILQEDVPSRWTVRSQGVGSRLMAGTHQKYECEQPILGVGTRHHHGPLRTSHMRSASQRFETSDSRDSTFL
jgi:hypothetical protein